MHLPAPVSRCLHQVSTLWSGTSGTSPYGVHEAGGDTLRREYRRRLFDPDPIYGEALDLVDRTTGQPSEQTRDTVRCIHCAEPIRPWRDPDGREYWLHIDSSTFPCRDDARLSLGTYATPPADSPAPLSSPDHHDPALVPDADAPTPPARPRPSRRPPRPYPTAIGVVPAAAVDHVVLDADQPGGDTT